MGAQNSSIGAIDRGILLFQGKTIEEVYSQIRTTCETLHNELLLQLITRIETPDRTIPSQSDLNKAEIEEAIRNLFCEGSSDYMFNHWGRVISYSGRTDQWAANAHILADPDRYSSRSTFMVFCPELDLGKGDAQRMPAPFFCAGHFTRDRDGRLGITGIYRRQEMSRWWIVNIWELLEYRDRMLELLRRQYELSLRPGPICTMAVSSWWSGKCRGVVDLPPFDEQQSLEMIPRYLAEIFEDKNGGAAANLVAMLQQKMDSLSENHAPRAGLMCLYDTLRLMKGRFASKDEELCRRLWAATNDVKKANDVVLSSEDKRQAVKDLRSTYQSLTNLFQQVISSIGSGE